VTSSHRVRIDADIVRRRTAEHMTRAIGEIPAFHLSREIDARRMAQAADRVGATITAVLLKHVAAWLNDVPELNSEFIDRRLRPRSTVDLGVALSYAKNVLVVPTLRDCRDWTEAQFADELKGLRRKADDNHFTVADFASAGFTVSNLGPWRVDSFTSIIRPPQVAILSVGAVQARPRVVDGNLAAVKTCVLTLAVDHRVIDGAFGASALDTLVQRLESLR
jgi:pyruvate dehydrogenase E2 component (dihydrolipoamide acetyltransferase)